ncbi:MAG TPA: hypothetical protein PK054_10235 [Anaerohalosphaeraceae bacterium]|nr:hypothetical protein [Anaerohalosphaeraceae bacterium]HOL88480.1 hypothetical protein [Anaerohalosphaeraceae bacterium]HPP56943.1 hypothetical protein [Anaerohalosphaeraceae bacterium]
MNPAEPSSSMQINGALGAASLAGTAGPKRKPPRKEEPALRLRYAGLFERVMQMQGEEPEVIRQARELILSGRADSMEAALETARRMLQYGI